MKTIVPYETRSYSIIFELLSSNSPEEIVNNYDELNPSANITCNFDYQKLFTGFLDVYIDIGLKVMPIGSILYRTRFQFPSFVTEFDNIFIHETIKPMVNTAIQNCINKFREECIDFEVKSPVDITINENTAQIFTNSIIEQYINYRKSDDEANAYLLNNTCLECASGNDTIITIICTFIIMDEVLYYNTLFNGRHNRKVFGNILSMPKYQTLKMNCKEIENEPVKLSFLDTISFFQCLDCALQVLLGDKADMLNTNLENKGIDKDIKKTYFKLGTQFFDKLHEMLETSNARILNLEEKHDWSKLIR